MSRMSGRSEPTVCILLHDKLAQEFIEKRLGISPLRRTKSGGKTYEIPQAIIDLVFNYCEESARLYSDQKDR